MSSCRPYLKGEDADLEVGEDARSAVGSIEGNLRVLFSSIEGKAIPVFVLGQGELCELGEKGWAAPDETMLRVQSERAMLCFLPPVALQDAVAQCPEALLAQLSAYRKLVRALGALAGGRLHDPATRVRHALWRATQDVPDASYSYTHEDLAIWVGTQRSRATEVIGQLRREGVVTVQRDSRRIIVLDPGRLTSQ